MEGNGSAVCCLIELNKRREAVETIPTEEGTNKYARARPFFTYSRGIQVSCLPDGVPSEIKPFIYIK
jgi:hypothetical protein|nr:hypothetical protein Q903MT_gene1187 [Picea sitchensis]